MIKEKILEELQKNVSQKRLEHIFGVLGVAKKLGEKYNVSQEKIEIAVLMHDFLKEKKYTQLEELCLEYNYVELREKEAVSEIIHGFAAAVYAMEIFEIYDINILNAIKYHTVGRKEMSLLEKIIYIADGIEPGRNYPEVEKIRKVTFEDIDKGIFYEIEKKIEYLKKSKREIHRNTFKMRDYFIELQQKEAKEC